MDARRRRAILPPHSQVVSDVWGPRSLGPPPSVTRAGIYLNDNCSQKMSQVGTFLALTRVPSVFIGISADLRVNHTIKQEVDGCLSFAAVADDEF